LDVGNVSYTYVLDDGKEMPLANAMIRENSLVFLYTDDLKFLKEDVRAFLHAEEFEITDKIPMQCLAKEIKAEHASEPIIYKTGAGEPRTARAKLSRRAEHGTALKSFGILIGTGAVAYFGGKALGLFDSKPQPADLGKFWKAIGNTAVYAEDCSITSMAYAKQDISDILNENSVVSGVKDSATGAFCITHIYNNEKLEYFQDAMSIESFDTSKYDAVEKNEFQFNRSNTWQNRGQKDIAVHGTVVEQEGNDFLKLGNNYILIDQEGLNSRDRLLLSFAKECDKEISIYGTIGETVPWADRKSSHNLFKLEAKGITYKP